MNGKKLFQKIKLSQLLLLLGTGILLLFLGRIPATPTVNKTEEEKNEPGELETLFSSIEGVGETRVFLGYDGEKKEVQGILIVCEGAENPQVVLALTKAAEALFQLPAHKIVIMKRTKVT